MNTHNFFRAVWLLLLGSLLLITVGAAGAQENNSLTLSEGVINEALRANIQNPDNDLSIDLQPGQIVVNLSITGQRGNTTTFALTLVPSVNPDGQLDFEATRLTLNGNEIQLNEANRAVDEARGALGDYLALQTEGGQLQRVTVTDSSLMLEWRGENPNTPIITINDNLFSLTFTESRINGMQWVTTPDTPNVQAINVDLQPGKAVVNITRTIEPANVAVELIPRTVNGKVTWQVNAVADPQVSAALSLLTVWRAYVDGAYNDGSLISVEITDSAMTFTWDLTDFNYETPSDPTVTIVLNEAEVNAALATFTTEDIVQLTVDMQIGRVVVNAVGLTNVDQPYSAAAVLVPEIVGGNLRWTLESLTYNGNVIEGGELRANTQSADELLVELNQYRSAAQVTDVQITDTDMTITVRPR